MKQTLFGSNTSPSGTQYSALMGASSTYATETAVRAPWPTPGTVRALVVSVQTAPGVGTSLTFTLRKNGAATALTVTISDTATTARLTGVDVAVSAGDLVALEAAPTGSPAGAVRTSWSLEFEGTTPQASGYVHSGGNVSNGTGLRYAGVFGFAYATNFAATADPIRNVVAAAGTVTGMVAAVATAPGASNGLTFYLNKNGVRQDGTGGTVNTACAMIGTGTAVTATYSLSLAPGDVVYTESVPSGTFTGRSFSFGVVFAATTDGDAQLCGSTGGTTFSTTSTQYHPIPSLRGTQANASETSALRTIGGVASVTLSGLQVLLTVAAGAGKTRLFDLRVNAASTAVTATISDTATTGSDLTHSATITDGDIFNLRMVPTGTPAAAAAHWGVIQRMAVTLIAVPDVVGETEAAAVTAIEGAGLTVGTITTATSDSVPAGSVISQSPPAGTLVDPGSAVDLVVAVAAGLVVVIDGVAQRILHDSLSIQATINGRDRLSATLPLPTVAPDVRQDIVVTFDGVRIFGGLLDTVIERAATSKTDVASALYEITAVDFNGIADWRYIDGISGSAETLKYALEALVIYLPGVTLNPAQVTGPVLPQRTYALVKVAQVLDEFTTITGYVWNIDYHGVLTMWEPGLETAPFDILDSTDHAKGDIIVEPIATEYATTILLVCGDSAAREVVDTFTGDGTTTVFPLHYPLALHAGTLTHAGVTESVGPGQAWTLTEIAAPHRPTYHLVRSIGAVPAVGAAIVFPYTAQFPLLIRVDDAAAVLLVDGYIERLVREPSIFSYDQGVAVAQGYLSQVTVPKRLVRYTTTTPGLVPGQTQTITIANRNLSGTFFITDVETRMQDPLLFYQVTASEAVLFQGSWRDVYRLWASMAGSTAGSVGP